MSVSQAIDSTPWSGISEEPRVEVAQRPVSAGEKRKLPVLDRHFRIWNWSVIGQLSFMGVFVGLAGEWISPGWAYWILANFVIVIGLLGFLNWRDRRSGKPSAVRLDEEGLWVRGWVAGPVPWAAVGSVTWHGPRWLNQLRVQIDPARVPKAEEPVGVAKFWKYSPEPVSAMLISGWSIDDVDEKFAEMIMEYRDNYCGTDREPAP